MPPRILSIVLIAALGAAPPGHGPLGVVFDDSNRNGTQDAGEVGVAGVAGVEPGFRRHDRCERHVSPARSRHRQGLNGYNDQPPAPSLITVRGKTVYRHSVSNAGDVLSALRKHRHVLALGGPMHATERIDYEVTGGKTHFNQVSAVVGNPRGAGLESISGVTLYRVENGEIDAGRFIRLDSSRSLDKQRKPLTA